MVRRLHDKLPVPKANLISVPVLPALMQDIIGETDKWGNEGKSGRIDPFIEVHYVSLFTTLSLSRA
jgi:hypothetical protein